MAQGGWFLFDLLGMGGGTITPVAPLSSSPVTQRDLVSLLDIRSHAQRLSGDQKNLGTSAPILAQALRHIQDADNSTNERLRRLSSSLNSVGLTRDASGNVAIQGSTFLVKLPLQALSMTNQNMVVTAPPAAPATNPPTSSMTWYLNEAGNQLLFVVTYSDGTTVKVGTVNLV